MGVGWIVIHPNVIVGYWSLIQCMENTVCCCYFCYFPWWGQSTGSKIEQVQGVLDSQPSLVPSRLPVELPGPGASELYILPAVKPDSEYLQLRICGTSLQPGLVNIQSWAMQMLFVVSYRSLRAKVRHWTASFKSCSKAAVTNSYKHVEKYNI